MPDYASIRRQVHSLPRESVEIDGFVAGRLMLGLYMLGVIVWPTMTDLEYEERQSNLLGGDGAFTLPPELDGEATNAAAEKENRQQVDSAHQSHPPKTVQESGTAAQADAPQRWDWWRAMAEAYGEEIRAAKSEFSTSAHEDISQKQVLAYSDCIARIPKDKPPPAPHIRSDSAEEREQSGGTAYQPLLNAQPPNIGAGGGPVPDVDALDAAKPTEGFAGGAWKLFEREVTLMVSLASELTAVACEVGR